MDKVTFLNSQIACAMIEAMGMVAENKQREIMSDSMAYVEDDFMRLIDKYGLGHNSVITYLQE
jgi:hypothetical protein